MKYTIYAIIILMSTFTYIFAAEDPIPGIDVIVERCPGSPSCPGIYSSNDPIPGVDVVVEKVPPGNAYIFIQEELNNRYSGSMLLHASDLAVEYMYLHGLTIFDTVDTFMGDKPLRRDEAAAFFARFARDVLGIQPQNNTTGCAFSDLQTAHQDLLPEIQAACELGLFLGHQGKFNPTNTLTHAQSLAVLIRLIDGEKEEPAGNRSINYYQTAQSWRLTQGTKLDNNNYLHTPITRIDVARLIQAAQVIQHVRQKAQEKVRPFRDTEDQEIVLTTEEIFDLMRTK